MSLIPDLADAITRQEGRVLNNNPGNIWDNMPTRIWPNLPIDSRGFVIYPTMEEGRAAMENQLAIKIARGETLSTLIGAWDSGDSPATRATYIRNVSSWTGRPPDVPLNSLSDTGPPYKPLKETHPQGG